MSTITTLANNATWLIQRTAINENFANLNADKAEKSGWTFTGDIIVPDEAYWAGWNGSLEVPTKNAVYDKIETMWGGGATTFLWLTDTPSSYTGQTGKFPKVNAGETALEFVTLAGGDALTSNPLSQFASTTSAQLAGVISDETGSGALVFATSPTLVTPVLGSATATSINGATITSGTLNGSVTGTNTGDQTSIVGLTGTMAQFDTAVTDGDIVYQSQALGTPASGTLTNCTGLPLSGVVDSTSEALGVWSIELWHATDTTLSRVSAGQLGIEWVRAVTTSPLVLSAASYTTDTGTSLDMDNLDMFIVTAQAGALLFNAPGGTLVQGRKLIIRIKDNWTSRALTYNAVFRAIGVTLPTATTISKTTYMWFVYNSTDTKWDCIAIATEA